MGFVGRFCKPARWEAGPVYKTGLRQNGPVYKTGLRMCQLQWTTSTSPWRGAPGSGAVKALFHSRKANRVFQDELSCSNPGGKGRIRQLGHARATVGEITFHLSTTLPTGS